MVKFLSIKHVILTVALGALAACGKGSFESGLPTTRAATATQGTEGSIESSADRSLKRLVVAGDALRVKVGESTQVSVNAEFSDGSLEDVSDKSLYTITNTGIATLTPNNDGEGAVITGQALGRTFLKITYDGMSVSIPIEIGSFNVVSMVIEPSTADIQVGSNANFKVIGILENQQTIDLTMEVTFESLEATKAGFSPANPGKIIALDTARADDGKGTATVVGIKATYENITASASVNIFPGLQLSGGEDQKIRVSSPEVPGETNKDIILSYLRPGEKVINVQLGVHSVDLKLQSFVINEPQAMLNQTAWFQQSLVLTIAAKWIGTDHAAEYRGQQIKFDVSDEKGQRRVVAAELVWITAPQGLNADDLLSINKKVFQGSEGDPSALPAEFPH